jgi:two-component system, chemotaxis family, sensor kinase CheA
MDVVRHNIQELGGTVKIGSTFGQGSKFTTTLPLTLAIMDGQSVCVGRETYIL